jgi:hypothetical protein
VDEILQEWNKDTSLGIYIGCGKYVKTILYADDHVILATSEVQILAHKLNKTTEKSNFKNIIREPR